MISSMIKQNGGIVLDIQESSESIIVKSQVKEFIKFKNNLEIITTIKSGDKLSKLDDNYYIDSVGLTQKWRRWWWNQNRNKTFDDLTTDFLKFADFLDNILSNFKPTNKQYLKLLSNIVNFINNLMIGLYNLKTTYPTYKKIRFKIDSIILTLIDFKDNINNIKATTPTINVLTTRRNSFDV